MLKYIQTFRLRTLPLSMAGIILGTGYAYPCISWDVFAFAILTTLSLQILANLCNEVGDAQHGTDDGQQARVAYGLQSGAITLREMWVCIYVFVGLCILFGSVLVWLSFGTLLGTESIIFLVLGALAIVGAMTYTMGKHAYGYHGFGDLGVMIFFGLLSGVGSYYLQTHNLNIEIFEAAFAIGMPIVGVINLNNIRDMENDVAHGKITLAARLGKGQAKFYHACLLVCSIVTFIGLGHYWVLFVAPVWVWHLREVFSHEGAELDRQMPVLMFSTLILAFLACL